MFHVFIGENYYPAGFYDYRKSFKTFEEALEYAKANVGEYGWFEVIESTSKGLVKVSP